MESAHDHGYTHVTRAVKGVVQAAVGDFNQVVLNFGALRKLRGVDKVRRAKLPRPGLLVGVRVDSDDA